MHVFLKERAYRGEMICSVALALVSIVVMSSTADAKGKWEKVGKNDGVAVSKMEVKGSDLMAFRGVIVSDVHIGKVMAAFVDESQRSKWVDRYHTHETFKKTDRLQVYRIHFKLPIPISDRDYVLNSELFPNPEKKTVTVKIKSVKHPKAPENDCCVRAEAKRTFYKFEALEGGKTRLTVEVQTDPKGMLPDWLINSIQEDWPSKTLNALIKQAKTQKAHSDYASWH